MSEIHPWKEADVLADAVTAELFKDPTGATAEKALANLRAYYRQRNVRFYVKDGDLAIYMPMELERMPFSWGPAMNAAYIEQVFPDRSAIIIKSREPGEVGLRLEKTSEPPCPGCNPIKDGWCDQCYPYQG